ncbi:MAG: hypothetical protein CSA58_08000 [Micrococcales bacterium]|nr:MAG: hypothetical protein CSB46_11445 [Micrococcales bacterium]PIE25820.1 MAG: hypothetical protein CSA58_13055 [Micrococcales bacterium]PIE26723.1 MAG: hypothetical protein CSA58_08000 [Micrococcales bacterium]
MFLAAPTTAGARFESTAALIVVAAPARKIPGAFEACSAGTVRLTRPGWPTSQGPDGTGQRGTGRRGTGLHGTGLRGTGSCGAGRSPADRLRRTI